MNRRIISAALLCSMVLSFLPGKAAANSGIENSETTFPDSTENNIVQPFTLGQPEISDLTITADGIEVSWDAVPGAASYQVLYRYPGTSWSIAGETTDTKYTVTDLEAGITYRFSVSSVAGDENGTTSSYDFFGRTASFISSPKVISSDVDEAVVSLTWDEIPGAASYNLYIRNADGEWEFLQNTEETACELSDLIPGSDYTFTVSCIYENGSESSYDTNGITVSIPAQPEITSLSITLSGGLLTWESVDGVDFYSVLVRTEDTEWGEAVNTTSTLCDISNLDSGTYYYFNVVGITEDGKSTGAANPEGAGLLYIAPPVITDLRFEPDGVSLTWDAVPGTEMYEVLYTDQPENTWYSAGITAETSFQITGLESGTTYAFTVGCINEDREPLSAYSGVGVSIRFLAQPEIIAREVITDGIRIHWNKVPGAQSYAIFYSDGGEWSYAGSTSSNEFLMSDLDGGTSYSFTVCCMDPATNTVTSAAIPDHETTVFLGAPALTDVFNTADGVTVNFEAVPGALGYRVLYKEAGKAEWTVAGDTEESSYTISGLTSGTDYCFTVACVLTGGQIGEYNNARLSIRFVAQPAITAAIFEESGVNLTWDPADGAEAYRVFYKTETVDEWMVVDDTTANELHISGLTSGETYAFTVCCVDPITKDFVSTYDPDGISVAFLSQPTLSSVQFSDSGAVLEWQAVTGAEMYRVYVKEGDSQWTDAGMTDQTSYAVNNLTSGKDYLFTVRCVSADGEKNASSYDASGLPLRFIAPPVLSTVTNSSTGVTVAWEPVPGAQQYRVYYKTADDDWKSAGTADANEFTVTGLKSGTTYAFTVRCSDPVSSEPISTYDKTGLSICYIAQPVLKSVVNVADGTTVEWEAVPGAELYRLYGKSGSENWTEIGTTKATGMTVSKLTSGTVYTYTVRCVNPEDNKNISSYDTNGLSIKYLSAPVLVSATNEPNGAKITWEAVNGAELYKLCIKKSGESRWKTYDYTKDTSMIVPDVVNNVEYTYTVVCVNPSDKVNVSAYDHAGISKRFFRIPELKSVYVNGKGINISWSKVDGVELYRVFYRSSSMTSWKNVADVKENSYVFPDLAVNETYRFTVRCMDDKGKDYLSSYDSAGLSTKLLENPVINTTYNSANGVTIKWNAVPDSDMYHVYYREIGGSWTEAGITTATAYTITELASGTEYEFTVRCMDKATKKNISTTSNVDSRIEYIAQPMITSAMNGSNSVTLTWNPVEGASKYRVYYKEPDGYWIPAGDCEGFSFAIKGLKNGVTYSFTIRCLNADGSDCTSSYDPIGLTLTH